jgi:hypothetical protein
MMKHALLIVLAAALAGCAHSSLPMTYQGKPRVPINKPTTVAVPSAVAQFTKGE